MPHAVLSSPADLIDHDVVVANHLGNQELSLLVGDVPEQRRGEGLEPNGELQIAPLLRPGAQGLELAPLPIVPRFL